VSVREWLRRRVPPGPEAEVRRERERMACDLIDAYAGVLRADMQATLREAQEMVASVQAEGALLAPQGWTPLPGQEGGTTDASGQRWYHRPWSGWERADSRKPWMKP
jgi:hypothetical protein